MFLILWKRKVFALFSNLIYDDSEEFLKEKKGGTDKME